MTERDFKPRIVLEDETRMGWTGAQKLVVLLDGQMIGTVLAGTKSSFFVEAGSHVLQVKLGRRHSEAVSFRVMVGDCFFFRSSVCGRFLKRVTLSPFSRQQESPRFSSAGRKPRFGRGYTVNMPWHQVLRISPNASFEEVVRAFKSRMSEYSYDAIMRMSEVDKEIAMTQVEKLNAAFAQAKAETRSKPRTGNSFEF